MFYSITAFLFFIPDYAIELRYEGFKCNKNWCFLNFSIAVYPELTEGLWVTLKNRAKRQFLKQLGAAIDFIMQ